MSIRRNALRTSLYALAVATAAPAAAQVAFTKNDIFFELNATDGDVGLHGLIDGESWGNAKILGPGGTFHVIKAFSNVDSPEFGMTELFFESNEPPVEERSFAELLMLFPPGTYQFVGTTRTGQPMSGSDMLTSKLPCPATLHAPQEAGGEFTLRWRLNAGKYDPDTGVCSAGGAAVIVGLEVTVEITDEETEAARTFTILLPVGARRLEIPEEYLEGVDPDATEAKFEVIVIEQSGNRTASEREFEL